MAKYLSNRQKNLKLGIVSYTENLQVLDITGNVGIKTTDTQGYELYITGDANISGIVTASAFYGDGSNLTGVATNIKGGDSGDIPYQTSADTTSFIDASTASVGQVILWNGSVPYWGIATYANTSGIATYTSEWTLGANGTSDFTFTGPGFTGAENDPTLYLTRGQQYKFINNSGGSHPFRIQSTPNGSTGTQYNDGITNNDTSTGTLTWDVQFDAPDILYYQCTTHSSMGGKIYIVNAGIASDVNLYTTGIATIGNVQINAGIITATSGIVTYYGDGQYLQNVSGGVTVTDDTSTNSTYYPVFVDTTSGNSTQTSVSSTKLNFKPSSGNFSATQFTSLSDRTKKKNIRSVENAIEITKQLEGVRFDWIDNDKPSVGLIAQDVEKVLPELVETSDDGTKSVSYGNIIGVLIEAIKEQQKMIDKLMEK